MLINRTQVRACALRCAEKRAHKFTRVSEEWLDEIDTDVLLTIQRKVKALPSMGKTIK